MGAPSPIRLQEAPAMLDADTRLRNVLSAASVALARSGQPLRDTCRGLTLLRRLHRETVQEPRSGCVRPKHREAAAKAISAMCDDGHQRLGRQVVGRKEGPNHRRRGFPPDRQTEIDRLVGGDSRYSRLQRRTGRPANCARAITTITAGAMPRISTGRSLSGCQEETCVPIPACGS